jgi:type II secretory ATPase GspE/PulE/Tfp pilus assembly ATPase PilB-like protein
MIDMGVEPSLLATSLILAQAQRLYRKLCTACRKRAKVDEEMLKMNHLDPALFEGAKLYSAVGCPRCANGYKGRGAIMEVLLVNEEIRDGILRGMNTGEMRKLAIKNGMVSLKQAGLQRVKQGLTSLEAALAETGGD